MVDSHIHSRFSHDGKMQPEYIVQKAVEAGLKYMAFTDHFDRDYLYNFGYVVFGQIDRGGYIKTVQKLKEKYAGTIDIALGAEFGYLKEAVGDYQKDLQSAEFDVILNSTHTVLGGDVYFSPFYKKVGSRDEAYSIYLDAVRESLDAPYGYDIVSHIGYVQKNAPYDQPDLLYEMFPQKIDDILKTIIGYDKCLEVNTKINTPKTQTMPHMDIIRRYYELGGRKISFGSDAHREHELFAKYVKTAAELKQVGFEGFTCYKARRPVLFPF